MELRWPDCGVYVDHFRFPTLSGQSGGESWRSRNTFIIYISAEDDDEAQAGRGYMAFYRGGCLGCVGLHIYIEFGWLSSRKEGGRQREMVVRCTRAMSASLW